jgi:subtilisin-like proprotein convertase family protein
MGQNDTAGIPGENDGPQLGLFGTIRTTGPKRRVNLHNRTSGSADNIVTTYTMATTPELNSLIGQPIQGVWKLHVSDHAGQDVGKLNRWQLKITKQP